MQARENSHDQQNTNAGELKLSTLWRDIRYDKEQHREFRLFWFPTAINAVKLPVTVFHEQLEAGMPLQDRYLQDYYKMFKRTHAREMYPHIERLESDSETLRTDPHVFQIYENCIDRKNLGSFALMLGGVFFGWNLGISYWGATYFTRRRMIGCILGGIVGGFLYGRYSLAHRVEACFEQIVNHEVSNMIIDRDYKKMTSIAKHDRARALRPLPAVQFEHSDPEMREREKNMHREHINRALRKSQLLEKHRHKSRHDMEKVEYRLVEDGVHQPEGNDDLSGKPIAWIDAADHASLHEFLDAVKDRKRSHYRKEFKYI